MRCTPWRFATNALAVATLVAASSATPVVAQEVVADTATELPSTGPLPTKILLGDPRATAGVPGTGPITEGQIEKWLARENVHEPLEVELPLGLAAASQKMVDLSDRPLTWAKIELGRQLYFDRRLSSDGTVSCATCHSPDFSYGFNSQFGIGVGGQLGGRNSPVSFNRILADVQFWDGRAATLEEQAVGPIANPIEMGNTHKGAVEEIAKHPVYVKQFEAIWGPESLNIDNVGSAIATFERTLVTGPSPYDYYTILEPFLKVYTKEDLEYLEEDDPETWKAYLAAKSAADAHPMSESAIRGKDLFFSEKSNCTACHAGANFSDELYHNLGVGMEGWEKDESKVDWGRYVVTKNEKDKGAFKTPTVRNAALTGPYMHDGSQKTLREVVDWYAKGGHANPWLSDKVKKLDLTEQDKQDLVAFMEALTSDFTPVVGEERLPE